MHTRKAITEALQKLGVQTGDLLMVHASLKAIGPVEGGAETVVAALRSAVGPTGTVMGYASWDRSPYEETLNGARLDDEARRTWLPFDPATAGTYRGFGLLNQFLVQAPGARRSAHPDASMVAVGPLAETLTEPRSRLGGRIARRAVRSPWREGPAVGCAAKLRYRIALRRGGCRYPQQTVGDV